MLNKCEIQFLRFIGRNRLCEFGGGIFVTMNPIDFESDVFQLFARQLKAMYNIDIPATERLELLGMVSFEQFKGFNFHHAFMDEAEHWFHLNSNTAYTGDDIQLWKLNNYLLLVRETTETVEPKVFGIYARDEK